MHWSHICRVPYPRPVKPKVNRRDQLLNHFRHLSSLPAWQIPAVEPVRAIAEVDPANQRWVYGVPLSMAMIDQHGWTNHTHIFMRWMHPSYALKIETHSLGRFAKRERIIA